MLAAEYVLPLRWASDEGLADLTGYLRDLRSWVDVTIVDGSPAPLFARHAVQWRGLARHVPVGQRPGRNGKVRGVLTGIDLARHELIIIADDDVRHSRETLAAVVRALARADLVKPQNYFSPLPWHARWDTARTLLNRAFGSDYPGTYGVRRSILRATGGYDGDVLFENLELERTVRAAGGRVVSEPGVFVPRRPPTFRHFCSQRVRQAYDSFAQPARLALELCLLPLVLFPSGRRTRASVVLSLSVAAVALAEAGRRRAGGVRVFPPSSALWAPAWAAERAVTIWLAAGRRLSGGVPYSGSKLRRAANGPRALRRRIRGQQTD